MKLSIRIRIALYVTFTFAVVIIALSFILMELYERYSYRSIDVTLQAAASSVANRLVKENMLADVSDITEDIGETVSNFENRIGIVRIGVFDGTHDEIFSYNDEDSIANEVMVRNELPGTGRRRFTTVSVHDRKFRCAMANFEIADTSQGSVIALASLASTQESIDRIRTIVFIIAPITILLVGIGSVFIAHRALLPLEKMASSIDEIQVLKPLGRLQVPGTGDEIAKVAESFNDLIERISGLIDSQRNFLLDASHELKTPLTVIQTEIEMLLMKPGLTMAERENLQQLLSEVEYASKLAVDLIYLSRLESSAVAEMRPVDLGSAIDEVVVHRQAFAESRHVNLRVKHAADLVVMGDKSLLARALSSIIDNAIKFSRSGGEVWVTGKHGEDSRRAILTIEDRGEGISEDELPRVFDKFYRTKSSRGGAERGSGLGLSIAKRIMEQHNGEITIESRLNVGTTVRIEIPETRIEIAQG